MLRDYQTGALNHTLAAIDRGRRSAWFTLPTGTGKTVVLAQLARRARRTVVLCHTRELAGQLRAALHAELGCPVGLIGDGYDEPEDTTVAIVQSLAGDEGAQRVCRHGAPDVLLIDEAHHATPTNRYGALIERLRAVNPALVVVGATATPWRSAPPRDAMAQLLGRATFARTLPQMIDAGVLAPIEYRRVVLDELELGALDEWGSRYEDAPAVEVAKVVDRRGIVERVVAGTAPLLEDRPTVVFAASVHHARHLASAYQAGGIASAAHWGAQAPRERRETLERWRAGGVQVVTSVYTLTEGFDFPEIAAVVMARPTSSALVYTQMLGRGTRRAPGKSSCRVIDVAGNGHYAFRQIGVGDVLGELVDDGARIGRLDGLAGLEHDARERRWFQDPTGVSWLAWTQHDGCWVATVDEHAAAALRPHADSGLYEPVAVRLDDRRVEPLGEPLTLPEAVETAERLAPRSPLSDRGRGWRLQPASDGQRGFLAGLGLHVLAGVAELTKGTASDAITAARAARLLRREPVA